MLQERKNTVNEKPIGGILFLSSENQNEKQILSIIKADSLLRNLPVFGQRRLKRSGVSETLPSQLRYACQLMITRYKMKASVLVFERLNNFGFQLLTSMEKPKLTNPFGNHKTSTCSWQQARENVWEQGHDSQRMPGESSAGVHFHLIAERQTPLCSVMIWEY